MAAQRNAVRAQTIGRQAAHVALVAQDPPAPGACGRTPGRTAQRPPHRRHRAASSVPRVPGAPSRAVAAATNADQSSTGGRSSASTGCGVIARCRAGRQARGCARDAKRARNVGGRRRQDRKAVRDPRDRLEVGLGVGLDQHADRPDRLQPITVRREPLARPSIRADEEERSRECAVVRQPQRPRRHRSGRQTRCADRQ